MLTLQRWIDKIALIISSILLGLMMIILAYNVVARFVGGGISWFMEGSQYLNVWAMFIVGISLCVSSDHLRITMVEELLKGRLKTVAKTTVSVVTFVFYILLTWGTFLLASKSKQVISTMPMLKMAYVYWLLPVVSGFSAISVVLGYIVQIRKRGEVDDNVSTD